MKKKLFLLGALTLLGTQTFSAEEAAATPQKSNWTVTSRTYIENEIYTGTGIYDKAEGINGFFIGQGFTASKGKLSLSFNGEQRLLGHQNSQGFDSAVSRLDYQVRYQVFDKIGVSAKYRSDNTTTGNDRDRYQIGFDSSYKYLSGWFVVGHDIDSKIGGAHHDTDNGNYYEGDMGPTFQLTDTFALRPTLYATGEFYNNGGDTSTMNAGQIRLMGIYNATPNLTLMPRVRYTIYKEIKSDSKTGDWTNYKAAGRIRAELLAGYKVTENLSVDGGVAYDTQTRKFTDKANTENSKLNMVWYTVGMNYKF